ncbi:MAG: type I DNA topoisomerase [Candidatus Saccharibacteria bacterium]
MPKNLVIVESPAKAKTIEKYLGSDFQVLSSMGHIRDLPQKGGGLGIDTKNKFAPTYEISPDKTKIVNALKKAAKGKDVWLATDEDREGEAISWHLCSVLKLDPKTTKRITFHEITKPAIEEAIKNPRLINLATVNAQQARRILDRLVGYELSPVLWKKIQTGLSAGRVQSVAVRLIADKEREIEKFEQKSDYKVVALFKTNKNDQIKAELSERIKTAKEAEEFLNSIKSKQFNVDAIAQKPAKKSPAPPFTTSTLQQAASSRLGYSVKQTMVLAQRLYEDGHISYMRTDSLNLSKTALDQIKKEVISSFGSKYYNERFFKSRSANAQEAHEAIRPTDFKNREAGSDPKQSKLYKLIWSRAMASQMSEALIEKTEISIKATGISREFLAKGEIVVFEGYLKAYQSAKQADPNILPDLKKGDSLATQTITATETFSRPPARYSEASLVKKLEAEGIGRPSTYAPTISVIQARGYVEKSQGDGKMRNITVLELNSGSVTKTEQEERYDTDRSRLVPTDTGAIVTDFLVKYFKDILDYQFTAKVEKQFDEIAKGKEEWEKMIGDFYKPFHKLVEESEGISRGEANQSRVLGKDPKSKKPVIARLGRFGAMIQIGEVEDEEKPKFAPMPEGKKISDVTLDEALKMFELPRIVGKTPAGVEIIAQIGRFGPYMKVGSINVALKGEDPFTVTDKRANELVAEHQKMLDERVISNFEKEGIQVLNGRFGPYITDGSVNAKIPKDAEPKELTLKDCKKILAEKSKKGKKTKK